MFQILATDCGTMRSRSKKMKLPTVNTSENSNSSPTMCPPSWTSHLRSVEVGCINIRGRYIFNRNYSGQPTHSILSEWNSCGDIKHYSVKFDVPDYHRMPESGASSFGIYVSCWANLAILGRAFDERLNSFQLHFGSLGFDESWTTVIVTLYIIVGCIHFPSIFSRFTVFERGMFRPLFSHFLLEVATQRERETYWFLQWYHPLDSHRDFCQHFACTEGRRGSVERVQPCNSKIVGSTPSNATEQQPRTSCL